MNNLQKKLIEKYAPWLDKQKESTSYERAKDFRSFKRTLERSIKDFCLVTIGIFSAAFGFKGFLLTNGFIDGGATGISLLILALTKIPLWQLIIAVNIPFILLGWKVIDKKFAIKTAVAISGLALVLATIPFPDVTKDNLLVAVFGGFFLGAGIGLSIRGGAVLDGTEVLAIFLSKKTGTTIGDIVIIINVIIFGVAAATLSVEIALYSMITYLTASKTLDFIIEGLEEYSGITIISSHHEKIKEMIVLKMGRGVTVYKGKDGYGRRGTARETDILFTVLSRLEINKLNNEIEKIDPDAFIVMNSVKDTRRKSIKKRFFKR